MATSAYKQATKNANTSTRIKIMKEVATFIMRKSTTEVATATSNSSKDEVTSKENLDTPDLTLDEVFILSPEEDATPSVPEMPSKWKKKRNRQQQNHETDDVTARGEIFNYGIIYRLSQGKGHL